MEENSVQRNLFGEAVIPDVLLRDKFIEPPFSILDAKGGTWQARKKKWRALGIKSEVGREGDLVYSSAAAKIDYYRVKEGKKESTVEQGTSIFDPALCELMYNWFCPAGGAILDPFAGGSVRGIVANYLGYKYTGIELRPEQVASNREQALAILSADNQPRWIEGNSDEVLITKAYRLGYSFDFLFSCPPYGNLEVYSELPDDISNMKYGDFYRIYCSIIHRAVARLKPGAFACFVVGEFRDEAGNYVGFVPDTVYAFKSAGMKYYNEAILSTPIASASMRADRNMKSGKLAKVHQNVLIFKKPLK